MSCEWCQERMDAAAWQDGERFCSERCRADWKRCVARDVVDSLGRLANDVEMLIGWEQVATWLSGVTRSLPVRTPIREPRQRRLRRAD